MEFVGDGDHADRDKATVAREPRARRRSRPVRLSWCSAREGLAGAGRRGADRPRGLADRHIDPPLTSVRKATREVVGRTMARVLLEEVSARGRCPRRPAPASRSPTPRFRRPKRASIARRYRTELVLPRRTICCSFCPSCSVNLGTRTGSATTPPAVGSDDTPYPTAPTTNPVNLPGHGTSVLSREFGSDIRRGVRGSRPRSWSR